MWFGSMSRGPRDPPEQGTPKETDNPVETERTDVTAAVNPPVFLPELPTWQSFKATFARMAREEARAKYVTKNKIKRLEQQLIVSIDGSKHTLRCGATVGSAYLATSAARLMMRTMTLASLMTVIADMVSRATTVQVTPRKLRKTR